MNFKLLSGLSFSVVLASLGNKFANADGHEPRKFKNIIMLIPDGCDDGVLGLARWYKNEPLQVDQMASTKVHPYMANSLMTDSAPGGTSYSSGQLTTDKFIAVGPRRDDLLSNLNEADLWAPYAPIPTNLEAANALGMGTGLISTSRITHATPAAFAAHVDSRSKEQEIAKQMVFNNVDVVMGGGGKNMIPKYSCYDADYPERSIRPEYSELTSKLQLCEGDCDNDDDCDGSLVCFQNDGGDSIIPGCKGLATSKTDFCVDPDASIPPVGARDDCLNLEEELLERGYDLCYTKFDLMNLDGEKAWCSFADSHMSPDIDRVHFTPTEPSIAEMTEKTIEMLSKNENGFFMMVEGSQVDWAGHANDPIWMTTDFIAWDDAVRVAVDFAKEDGETLVLALPDHNTGGLKVGNFNHDYLDRTVEFARDPLLQMKMTSGGVVKSIDATDPDNITEEELKASVLENWGFNITDEEATEILEYSDKNSHKYLSYPGSTLPLNYGLSRVVSEEYTIAGWTSHGHNGEDVPMWVYGMEAPTGMMTNTEVGLLVKEILELPELDDELYVNVDTAGLTWSVSLDDVTNQFATIEGFVFPLNTDYFLKDDERVSLPGITVYAPLTGKLYTSNAAINMIQTMI